MSLSAESLSGSPLSGYSDAVAKTDVTTNATGFQATSFGQPKILLTQLGWQAAKLGTPLSINNRFAQATGWQTTQLGAPNWTTQVKVSGFVSAAFGTPRSYPQIVRGFKAAAFGKPHGIAQRPAYQVIYPQGARHTQFGAARVVTNEAATGWITSTFGVAQSYTNTTAVGFKPTQFGMVGFRAGCHPMGFTATHFGSAMSRLDAPFPVSADDFVYVLQQQRSLRVVT